MSFDIHGIPYTQSWGTIDTSSAVDLGSYEPPHVFDAPGFMVGPRNLKLERGANTQELYGTPISHHGQQVHALNTARERLSFDSVGVMLTHFSRGDSLVYVDHAGNWLELPVDPAAISG